MIPKSLSASSVAVYENCPARWKAEYEDKTPGIGGSAASLGTVCHAALELWVSSGAYKTLMLAPDDTKRQMMRRFYEAHYRELFEDETRFKEGLMLCMDWMMRQEWEGREVLSTETKESFDLRTSIGPIPFNYIWDRCDRLANGDIDVVDYKTYSRPVSPEDMRHRVQPRLYAVAAQLKFPEAKRIWVTYDLLRYTSVGTVFTVEENREAYKYLRAVAERIIADDGTTERLNDECRWCLRRQVCESLTKHAAAGGTLGITDPHVAAVKRAAMQGAIKALEANVEDLDKVILDYCEKEEVISFTSEDVKVDITASRRRQPPDTELARRILGDELVARHSKMTMGEVDALLKGSELTSEQKSAFKGLIRWQYGDAKVTTRFLSGLDE